MILRSVVMPQALRERIMDKDQITPHFHLSEFRCRDGTDYPPEWISSRLVLLCVVLEGIREACGGHPMQVISGYRTLGYNRSVGSKDTSQHVQGRAADIRVRGVSPEEVAATARRLSREKIIPPGGIGEYPRKEFPDGTVAGDFVHIDVRGRRARWKKS